MPIQFENNNLIHILRELDWIIYEYGWKNYGCTYARHTKFHSNGNTVTTHTTVIVMMTDLAFGDTFNTSISKKIKIQL